MVHIIKKKWKKKSFYYIYDNKWDDVKKKYKKVYLGKATEDEYNQYKIEQEKKKRNPNYCNKCGFRIPITVPPYMRYRMKLCRCQEEKGDE